MTSDARRSRQGRAAGVLACALALVASACADFSRGEPSPPKPDAGQPSSDAGGEGGAGTSFATTVHPLLTSGCQRCHAAGQEAGNTQLLLTGSAEADYATVNMFVDTSAPSGSRLLAKMSGNGHQGGTVYAAGSPEYQTILQWIQQGAPP
jgi:hypothetical protein